LSEVADKPALQARHDFGPHAFAHMLARHATKDAASVAEIVASSQNPGHTDALTTLPS